MEREKLYSCGLTDYLLDKESSIKNPLEKIEDIKKWLDKKNYTEEQINMIIFSLLVLSEEFKDNKIIKIVNKMDSPKRYCYRTGTQPEPTQRSDSHAHDSHQILQFPYYSYSYPLQNMHSHMYLISLTLINQK